MQTLVVDANFLMSTYKFKVDAILGVEELVGRDYLLVTSSSIVVELERIRKSKGKASQQARYALGIIRKYVKVIRTTESADQWIEMYCLKNNAIACTNDAELRKRLKKNGIKTIVLRGRSRLSYA